MSRARILGRLSLILLILQSVSCVYTPNGNGNEILCRSKECRELGSEYTKNMDMIDGEPCQDFYKFACGNWHRNHPGPKYASDWSLMEVMNANFAKIIRQTLESYKFEPGMDDSMRRQAKEVYTTCVRIPEYPTGDAKAIKDAIIRIGRYPNVSLWDIHSEYLKLTGESGFFDFKVIASYPSEEIPVLMLLEPISAYGSIFHQPAWKPLEEIVYRDFLTSIMMSLNLGDSNKQIKQRVDDVFKFRKNLESILDQNAGKNPEKFNPLTEEELQQWFSRNVPNLIFTQKVNWTEVVEVLLHHLPPETRQTRKVVAIRQKQYFLDLMNLINKFPREVLANHMEIYFVERHLQLKPNMINLLKSTSMEPHGLLTYIRERDKERWELCIKNLNMVGVLDRLLYDKWFPKQYENITAEIIMNIKEAINKQMEASNWLDEPTREITKHTFYELEEWIGFPTSYRNHAIPEARSSSMEILSPNAALYNAMNLLYIHAPLLMPPIFNMDVPLIYNYAGLGTTIGHELYHVIEDCGSYAYRNESIVWWEPRMRWECLDRMELFVRTYNEFTDREFKNRYDVVVKSNTSMTLLENLPDVMGLDAAYKAYKELLSKDHSVCQVLPGFEKYSCNEMFYIAFANTYCGYDSKKSALNKLRTWDHSIDSVRINTAVAQMESFGRAFKCRRGSDPLHPRKKLDMWR